MKVICHLTPPSSPSPSVPPLGNLGTTTSASTESLKVLLLGPASSGKSTLLRTFIPSLPPVTQTVAVGYHEKVRELASYLDSDFAIIIPTLTPPLTLHAHRT